VTGHRRGDDDDEKGVMKSRLVPRLAMALIREAECLLLCVTLT
jgi:hypothetical protein